MSTGVVVRSHDVSSIRGQKKLQVLNQLYSQNAPDRSIQEAQERRILYLRWREEAAAALEAAALVNDAAFFRGCQRHYDVDVCIRNVEHAPRAVPYTCHLRVCPDCERREQARKLKRFIPAIHDLLTLGKPGYTLKHVVLTTPYALADEDAPERFKSSWKALEKVLGRVFVTLLGDAGKLSAKEKRRKEVNLKSHGIGVLAASEFGEDGHKLHFHLMAYCPYIPINFLVEQWQQVTQGECKVSNIKKIDLEDVAGAVVEVSKYVTKFSELSPALVPALAKAIAGSRRLRTYGALYGIGKTETTACGCPLCSADRQLVSILTYLRRCEERGVSPDGTVIEKAENAAL